MSNIAFLIMRRMRIPLLVLLSVYTLAIVGMTLVPGQDDQGNLWYMDFFHAFYFVSYMGTTIGFGEIPYAFSAEQRLWATFSMYLTVVAWIYAIGTILTLVQDEALRRVTVERRFSRTVKRIREPFYLICGYGDTGRALVSALEERFTRCVVIEIRQEKINDLILENYPVYVPKLCADASQPTHLLEGGLKHPYCAGVVALTNDNLVNLNVAIASKLLNPTLPVLCRVDADEVAANMLSFGTDYIINPFTVFARQLHTALKSPSLHLLREWLAGRRDTPLSDLLSPPRHGLWIICGYGRFGKVVHEELSREQDLQFIIIEAKPEAVGYPKTADLIEGRGTEAVTLQQAHIQEAVGIVAGTDNDIDNLSIIMTARELNPDLFVIVRQNSEVNQIIFNAAKADITMQASQIIADYIRVLLNRPLLIEFMREAKKQDNDWACQAVSRIIGVVQDTTPNVWDTTLNHKHAPTVCDNLEQGHALKLKTLLRDPRKRSYDLECIPLLLIREKQKILLPDYSELLQVGDRILWCGNYSVSTWMEWTLRDPFVFTYVYTGKTKPRSYIGRWWQHIQEKKYDIET